MTEKSTNQGIGGQSPTAQAVELIEEDLDKVHGGRSRGDTTLGDVVVVKQADKSTAKL